MLSLVFWKMTESLEFSRNRRNLIENFNDHITVRIFKKNKKTKYSKYFSKDLETAFFSFSSYLGHLIVIII